MIDDLRTRRPAADILGTGNALLRVVTISLSEGKNLSKGGRGYIRPS
jgi:hypothetical protein